MAVGALPTARFKILKGASMGTYIIRRILSMIPMMLVITFIIYLALELTPGDAVSHLIPPDSLANVSPEKLEAVREEYGLNDPFLIRYFHWIGKVIKGDFGFSITSGVPISEIIYTNLGPTVQLALASLLISSVLGSVLGLFSALKKGSLADNVLSVAGMIGVSIPQFFFAIVCVVYFVIKLKWFPMRILPHEQSIFSDLKTLFLPAMILGIAQTAAVMRYTRAGMLGVMNKDFIKTARSKGLSEVRVNLVHGFRVALTPVVVLVGFRLPTLISGSVVIESIFQRKGIGVTFVTAVRGQNYPLVMMIALFLVMAVLVASLLVDIFTALLDPRVKLG
jgi:peptide/nickel transport system permease protein